MQHQLRMTVTRRFQEDGVHIAVAGDARSLCLYGLRPPDLEPFGCDIAVEGHILRLEGRRPVPVLRQDTAESGRNDALSDIGGGADDHQRADIVYPR